MSHLHDPSYSRHARVFELLHQTQQASRIIDRVKIKPVTFVDETVALKIQENAIQSLHHPGFAPKRG